MREIFTSSLGELAVDPQEESELEELEKDMGIVLSTWRRGVEPDVKAIPGGGSKAIRNGGS
ncbi:UNVERIFIED_CONTAM: hypothetical protein Slati_0918800 [Sesamum latifolium]|uniref:Uncharacterized protein n=1 Tax=Sesamum latifolium TaxID=2727402 RepID=A0AAW2XPX6_9LAMI